MSIKVETPLIIACERGSITVDKHLIKAGVDINQSAGNKTHIKKHIKKNIGLLQKS